MNDNIVEQIIQMRKDKHSMKSIAKTLGISRNKVRYHCIKNNLGGVIADNPFVSDALEIFKNNLIKNNHPFEYVSDFVNTYSNVKVKCKVCGKVSVKAAQFAKKKRKPKCLHCLEKAKLDRLKEIKPIKLILLNKPALTEVFISDCKECGKPFRYCRSKRAYCSDACSKRSINRRKERRHKRIVANGNFDSSITLIKLHKKYKGECYLCGGKCDWNDKEERCGTVVVGKLYPSVEHVIPISKGGTHTWDNVRLAHHYCNAMKRDKKILEDTGQLVLML